MDQNSSVLFPSKGLLQEQEQQRALKRIRKNKIFSILLISLSLLSLVPLFFIIGQVFLNGILHINWELFTQSQPPPNSSDGGILNAILGSVMILLIAVIISVPIAVLAALYISENKKKNFTHFAYACCNILQSVPAIIIGIIAFAWLVKPMGGFSLFSGSVALMVMMLPYITVNTVEILDLIPNTLKEAGYALGGSYSKVVYKIILPIALPGILNGVLIALSRVAGEAAPLLFTAFGNPYVSFNIFEPVASLPLIIFQFSISPYETWKALGWGASFILLFGIIITNILSKSFSKNYYKK